jgi:hypothetical protein
VEEPPYDDVEELMRWGYERRTRRLEEYFDRAEALEAVGLPDE